jgi:hypothetical protein
VNATDNLFNLVPSASAKVKMTVTDPYATQTNVTQDLINGTTAFALQFLTASGTGWKVHVSTTFGDALLDNESAALLVNANTPTKIMVTVPGTTLVPGNVSAGGLSGKPLQQRSTEVVQYIHKKSAGSLSVIGSGGIFTGGDASKKLDAGASLIEVWTGFIYEGPFIVRNICKHLAKRIAAGGANK